MSKRLVGIIGCKDKTSSWHLIGFPDGSNIGSIVSCRGCARNILFHVFFSSKVFWVRCRRTKRKRDRGEVTVSVSDINVSTMLERDHKTIHSLSSVLIRREDQSSASHVYFVVDHNGRQKV